MVFVIRLLNGEAIPLTVIFRACVFTNNAHHKDSVSTFPSGDTINIPDSVMGLTFLAAGTSVPEAVSSVIVTNQGHGAMGISNSIGSNTFDILLCLGLPWFVKAYFLPAVADEPWVSEGDHQMGGCIVATILNTFVRRSPLIQPA